jgi:peptidoglycan hydrolase CwlO-like protein
MTPLFILIASAAGVLLGTSIASLFLTLKIHRQMEDFKAQLEQLANDTNAALTNINADVDKLQADIANLEKKITDNANLGKAFNEADQQEIISLFSTIKGRAQGIADRTADVLPDASDSNDMPEVQEPQTPPVQ